MEENKKNQTAAAEEKKEKKAAPKSRGEWKRMLNNKNFKYGSYATILIAVVVVIAILLNVGVVMLVENFPSLKLDLTQDGRYQVSDKMHEVLDDLEMETTLIFCSNKESFETTYNNSVSDAIGGDSLYEGTRIVEMMSKAGEEHDKLTVKFLDLESNPNLFSSYSQDLVATDVIVVTENRFKILHISDFYQLPGSNSVTGAVTNNSSAVSYFEYEIGNAIINVNSTNVPKIAFTSGHGESTPSYLIDLLEDNCFDTVKLDMLTTTEIPEDIDAIAIYAPTSDFTEAQIKLMEEFLYNNEEYGKSVVLMLSPTIDKVENLNTFLRDWGYEIGEIGSYVMESDEDKYVSNPMFGIAEYVEEGIYQDMQGITVSYGAVPVRPLWDSTSHGNYQAQVVMQTPDSAYAIPGGEDASSYKPNDDEYKSFPLVTLSQTGYTKNNQNIRSYVGIVSSAYMFNDVMNSFSNIDNGDCAISLFQTVTGTTGNGYSVYIKGLSFTSSDLTVTAEQATTIGITLFAIIAPLAVMGCGLGVWLRRRHL